MSKIPDDNSAKIIYEYAENWIKVKFDEISKTNQKITTLLASSGILLKFTSGLYESNVILVVIKLLACLGILATISFCLTAILPRETGKIFDLKGLYEERYSTPEDETKLMIVQEWSRLEKDLYKEYKRKANLLRGAYKGLGFAAFLFGLNIVVNALNNSGISW